MCTYLLQPTYTRQYVIPSQCESSVTIDLWKKIPAQTTSQTILFHPLALDSVSSPKVVYQIREYSSRSKINVFIPMYLDKHFVHIRS